MSLLVTRENVKAYKLGNQLGNQLDNKIFAVDPRDGHARDIRTEKNPTKEESMNLKEYWDYE